jgi:Ca-activated chloride channel homolog
VTDAAGRLVPGLTRDNFIIFEDMQPQEVAVFARDPQPVALTLLMDTSTSMESRMAVSQEAAVGFAKQLKPTDVAQIVDFNTEIQVRQAFTNDAPALERAIRSTRSGGSTALYNALYMSFADLHRTFVTREEIRRQAIVVLSDGEDTNSLVVYDDVLDSAKRSDATVYAIGIKSREAAPRRVGGFNESDFVLRTISQQTGGRVFFVDDASELRNIYSQIADELSNQYLIGYTSKNTKRDGSWRQIAVRVVGSAATARTKGGYYAPKR